MALIYACKFLDLNPNYKFDTNINLFNCELNLYSYLNYKFSQDCVLYYV